MSTSRGSSVAALAAVLLLLSGCSASMSARPSSTPSLSATAVFASDEEALAAAEQAYKNYLQVGDDVTADPDASIDRLRTLVTDDQFARESTGLRSFVDEKLRSTGASSFDSMQLQRRSETQDGEVITAYACLDVMLVRIVNDEGVDVTPSSRPDRQPVVLTFLGLAPSRVLVANVEPWPGESFC